LLNALPGDVTFVGPDDTILYYNEPRQRLFGRTEAILGTSVQSCHPAKSVPAVDRILRDLKAGSQDTIEFWITLRDRLVWIRYIAARGRAGEYLGCLEIAQDVTAAQEHSRTGPNRQ
jgi:DUF438 domain-containing protein